MHHTNWVLTQRCAVTELVGGLNSNLHQSGCRAFKPPCFGFILTCHEPNPVVCVLFCLCAAYSNICTADQTAEAKLKMRQSREGEARRFVTPRLTNPDAKITGLGLTHVLRI